MNNYVTQFEKDGVCIIRGAIDQGLVAKVNAQIDAFRNKNDLLL